MFLRRQPSREREKKKNTYTYECIYNIFVNKTKTNTYQMFLRRQPSREEKKRKNNIHIHMNTYITYLSTRPEQTHSKCF